jgi:hypothetical protein
MGRVPGAVSFSSLFGRPVQVPFNPSAPSCIRNQRQGHRVQGELDERSPLVQRPYNVRPDQ